MRLSGSFGGRPRPVYGVRDAARYLTECARRLQPPIGKPGAPCNGGLPSSFGADKMRNAIVRARPALRVHNPTTWQRVVLGDALGGFRGHGVNSSWRSNVQSKTVAHRYG